MSAGGTQVPGGTIEYRPNSFMVSQEGDSYHPNVLTGYLFALMTYCAITGESSVGQPYDFCYDESNAVYPITDRYEVGNFKTKHYTYDNPNTDFDERNTNFVEIFNSSADMAGLQELVNSYVNGSTDAWEKYIEE